MGEFGGAAGDALGAEVAVDLGGGGDVRLAGEAGGRAEGSGAEVADVRSRIGGEQGEGGDDGGEQAGQARNRRMLFNTRRFGLIARLMGARRGSLGLSTAARSPWR